MTLLALCLVLMAAFLHAGWNLLAKRVAGGLIFIWLVCAVAALVYLPFSVVLVATQRPVLGWSAGLFIVGSGALHIGYFFLLQRGYQSGDLSLVYPLARSTGPALSALGAVLLLGERPTPVAGAGIALVLLGVLVLTRGATTHAHGPLRAAMFYAVLTGTFIAAYTLWDAWAVRELGVPPLLLDWGSNVTRAILLLPLLRGRGAEVQRYWRRHRGAIVAISLASTLSYILVLTAMQFTPVSYVAPAREISILIGAAMGARVLQEGGGRRRLIAAAIMVAGVMALALGG